MTKATHAHFWNSSKIKRLARSTIAPETLSLSKGCNAAMYINMKHVSIRIIIWYYDEKQFIIPYTDNQSLYHAAHSLKQTLENPWGSGVGWGGGGGGGIIIFIEIYIIKCMPHSSVI